MRAKNRADALRSNIESLIADATRLSDWLGRENGAREAALVSTKLEEAKHWLSAAREKLEE